MAHTYDGEEEDNDRTTMENYFRLKKRQKKVKSQKIFGMISGSA